ncbi:MAG: CoA transferase [Proteobacteria bacterium]|nr:CoA transferase [Pseudomonadota bacterium]
MTNKPLSGIRVIDLTRVLAGPFCTMILKDLGAEVIKIEVPRTGDDSRQFGPFLDPEKKKSAYFISINCGKKSVTLDLKTDQGGKVLADLIKKSDVLVENFRPGTLEHFGFSEERIRHLNPTLIYASASGFGYSGPESKKAAYDAIIQALSGIMSITGTEEGECVRVGTSIADIVTGLYTVIGVLSGLYRLSRIEQGARIDVAMLDSAVSVLENAIARYQVLDEIPKPIGSRHPSITPFETFKTKDSEIIIAAGNEKLFSALCGVIGKPELVDDDRFTANISRTENFRPLREIINSCLSSHSSDYWLEKLNLEKIPCAKINNTKDLFEYEQIKIRNMLVPVEGEDRFMIAGNPIKFKGESDTTQAGKPPVLGEHNHEILEGLLGYSKKTIVDLYKSGVLSD